MIDHVVLLGQMKELIPPEPIYKLIIRVLYYFPFISIAFYIFLAICIYKVAKYYGRAGREQKLLRIEMGKLAEEVHLLRQETKDDKKLASSNELG
ncbi:MAG: hypothetical protein ACYSTT_19560 [Planctomycetota bacterium]|jgi:hypothetical protein